MGSLDVARTRTEFGLDSGSLCACVRVCVFFSLAWRFVLVCFAYFEGVDLHAHVHCCFMLWLCVWAYMGPTTTATTRATAKTTATVKSGQ